MTALVRAELRRARSRRVVKAFALLSLLAAVVVGVVAFTQTSSADSAAIAAKVEQAKAADREAETASLKCLYEQSSGARAKGVEERCPPPERHRVHDPRLHRQKVNDLLKATTGIAALIGLVIGASLIGAEQQSRGTMTMLTFAPQRGRVFGAKLLAALTVAAVWAAGTLLLVLGGLLPAALAHAGPALGQPGNMAIAAVMAKGVALTAITTGIGFAIASIGRNTAAALGVAFAYLIVLENILGGALADWRRWLLIGNVIVFLDPHGAEVPGRSAGGAAAFLVAVAGALLLAGVAIFRARDVA